MYVWYNVKVQSNNMEEIKETNTPEAVNETPTEVNMVPPREPEHLRRKKRKTLAWAVFGVSSGVLALLVIIALLGQRNGSFTIKLENAAFKLTLGNSLTNHGGNPDVNNGASFLLAEGFKAATPMKADDLPTEDVIDADIADGSLDVINPKPDGLENEFGHGGDYSYKFTFYLQNTSFTEIGQVNYYIDFTSMVSPSNYENTGALEDFLRVRVYDTVYSSTTVSHDLVGTYGRQSHRAFPDNGDEPITKNPEREENKGNCKSFLNDFSSNPMDMIIMTNHVEIQPREIRRYTVVMWLEGHDRDCEGENPVGASLALAMHFTTEELNSQWTNSSVTASTSASLSSSN